MKPIWACIYYSSFLLHIFYCRCLRRLGTDHRVDLHTLTFVIPRYLEHCPYDYEL